MMETFGVYVQPFFQWLIRSTLQAGVIVCLILLFQAVFRHRLGVRWHHALWLILMIRMVLPWAPQSRWSVFNVIAVWDRPHESHSSMAEPSSQPSTTNDTGSLASQPVGSGAATKSDRSEHRVYAVQTSSSRLKAAFRTPARRARDFLPLVWAAGALALGVYIVASNLRLWRAISIEHPSTDKDVLELLEECRAQMGLRTLVALVTSSQVNTPVLLGFIRPRLLIPQNIARQLTHEELRYVFLHELAHVKRHDIALAWLTALLQMLHWFNPLVWLAFHRMRADREMACDALVLTRTHGEGTKDYGRAIVSLLERFSFPPPLPGLAGILENKSQLKRRIAMITQFQNHSYRWSPLAVVLIVAVACLTLPNARQDTTAAAGNPAGLTSASEASQQPVFRKIRIPNRMHYDAQLSPDGKSIALGIDEKLWIMPRVGPLGPDYPGTPQLVDTGETKVDPYGFCWSADGRWIAFNAQRGGNYRMYVVSAQGGMPKEVYNAYRGAPTHNRQMSLSPNGKILAFSSVDANELHIYTIPVEGGVPKRLVDTPAREPVFSQDGKMIACVEDKNLGQGGGGLWVVPADGGTPKRVAEAGNACSPVWSPDGRMIAFFDWKVGGQIYVVPINEDGAQVGEKITIAYPKETGGLYRLTGWTPDNKIGAILGSPAEGGLYALPLKGGKAVQVTRGGLQPHWSADGKRIILSKSVRQKQASDGWLAFATAWVPAEGGQATTIPIQADTNIVKAGWGAGNNVSPDSKTIVFAGRKVQEGASTMQVWTLPIEGGKPTQLTNASAPLADQFPCWSPDGKAIAFVRSRDCQHIVKRFMEADIFIIPAAGGEPRQLTSESDMVAFGSIAWSPDGKLLAYLSIDNQWSPEGNMVRVIPAEGGQSRAVTKLQRGFEVNVELAWSPDSRRIALNDGTIKIISLDDGQVVDVDPGVKTTRLYHLDWSRDGEKLVFAGQQGGGPEFWLIGDFLPTGTGAKDLK